MNSRTFSIAMTAWSAKVLSRLICFSVKGRTSVRRITIAPIATPSRINGVPSTVRVPSVALDAATSETRFQLRPPYRERESSVDRLLPGHRFTVDQAFFAEIVAVGDMAHSVATRRMTITVDQVNGSASVRRKPCGALRNHIQHRLNIRRRAGDDTQGFHWSQSAAPTIP